MPAITEPVIMLVPPGSTTAGRCCPLRLSIEPPARPRYRGHSHGRAGEDMVIGKPEGWAQRRQPLGTEASTGICLVSAGNEVGSSADQRRPDHAAGAMTVDSS
jgi:hypothetical protein